MRTTWMLAAIAAFAALPAAAQTVVEKQVTTTTQTQVDCATIINDAERLACWQSRAYVAPSQTTERVTSTAAGTVRTVETTTPTAPVVTQTRTVTTNEAPTVVSRTTTTTHTHD